MLAVLSLAMAQSVNLVIEGETLLTYHGDYCSFPKVPGITTKDLDGKPPTILWDHVFVMDPKIPFTGAVTDNDDKPVGASPMNVTGDLQQPEHLTVRMAVATCSPHKLDKPGLEELLRKSNAKGRSLLVRHLLNHRIQARACAIEERSALMKEALTCQDSGKCSEYLVRLEAAGTRCK